MSLIAKNISVNIGNTELLNAANINCSPGEIVALCGANGAGKSTLLKAIAGD